MNKINTPIQINGKIIAKIDIDFDFSPNEITTLVLNTQEVIDTLRGENIKKVVVIPGKLVNIVK